MVKDVWSGTVPMGRCRVNTDHLTLPGVVYTEHLTFVEAPSTIRLTIRAKTPHLADQFASPFSGKHLTVALNSQHL
ncbi:hypothetical protein [Paraburkholderia sp. HP33-1]|uniref:hypothetical protein n=1 Tax=Paraburkholderia sp. HP33-1 TaxID=2883243 RepID=UPI001F2F505A|nr:hypothetical protein [Paraburkholderia sp. HP33-1]